MPKSPRLSVRQGEVEVGASRGRPIDELAEIRALKKEYANSSRPSKSSRQEAVA